MDLKRNIVNPPLHWVRFKRPGWSGCALVLSKLRSSSKVYLDRLLAYPLVEPNEPRRVVYLIDHPQQHGVCPRLLLDRVASDGIVPHVSMESILWKKV